MLDTIRMGEFLRKVRDFNDLTQKRTGEYVKLSEREIRYIESGSSTPSLNNILQLCDVYGISISEIECYYKRSEEMEYIMNLFSYKSHKITDEEIMKIKE